MATSPATSAFICAVHTEDGRPAAYALVEQRGPRAATATYHVHRLHALADKSRRRQIADAMAADSIYAGATTLVTTGGQAAADYLAASVASAVPVMLTGERSGDTDAMAVAEQVLVDTFERLYREGAVEVPGTLDEGSAAVTALYRAADLEAAAPDADYDAEGNVEDERAVGILGVEGDDMNVAEGAKPDLVGQSGGQAELSTRSVGHRANRHEAQILASELSPDYERRGRIAGFTGQPAPDMGEHRAVALALALACWYGEATADDLPVTDKADEAIADLTASTGPESSPQTGGDRPSQGGAGTSGDGKMAAQQAQRANNQTGSNQHGKDKTGRGAN